MIFTDRSVMDTFADFFQILRKVVISSVIYFVVISIAKCCATSYLYIMVFSHYQATSHSHQPCTEKLIIIIYGFRNTFYFVNDFGEEFFKKLQALNTSFFLPFA